MASNLRWDDLVKGQFVYDSSQSYNLIQNGGDYITYMASIFGEIVDNVTLLQKKMSLVYVSICMCIYKLIYVCVYIN